MMYSYLSILSAIGCVTHGLSWSSVLGDVLQEGISSGIEAGIDQDSCVTFRKSPGSVGAQWCADEGGHCDGPAVVYFGEGLTWKTKWVDVGESIQCSNGAFDNCDPLKFIKKRCYKKPAPIITTYPDMNKFHCPFEVLSTDHISGTEGKYFNFDRNALLETLNLGTFESGHYWLWNPQRHKRELVIMWGNANGGSEGDGHGRLLNGASSSDWQTGDILALLSPEREQLQCVDYPSNVDYTKEGKCAKGNSLNPDYHYVYNRFRGTDDARCGKDANCWCCRAPIPDFC